MQMNSVVPEGLYAVTVHFGSSEEIGVKASTVFMNGIIEKASKIRVKSGVFIHNVHSNDPTKYRKTAFLGGLSIFLIYHLNPPSYCLPTDSFN